MGKRRSKIKIKPLDDRIVIERLEAEETTVGGIVLPDSAKEKPQRGRIVAVGPGKLLDSGERAEVSVEIGDVVVFGKFGGTDVTIDNNELIILRESDILALVGEPTTKFPDEDDEKSAAIDDDDDDEYFDEAMASGDPTTPFPDDED